MEDTRFDLCGDALKLLSRARTRLEAAGVSAVGVFGSAARGEEGHLSDLDVVVVCSDIRAEDGAARAVREALRSLRREIDVNFPTNLGLGSRLWANVSRDARIAFGALPVARPRKVPIPLDTEDGMRVLEAMVRRWPRLAPALEAQRTASGDDIGKLATRLLANGLASTQAREFIVRYDETALAELGRDCDWIEPAEPGPDPRKNSPRTNQASGLSTPKL